MNESCLHPGQKVQFRLGDIHLPEIAEVLARMTEDTELQGHITLLSDQGEQRSAFAVVEVKGILMPLIVPAGCIKVLTGEAQGSSASSSTASRDSASHGVSVRARQAQ